MLIAIDFGTTGSGFAVARGDGPPLIREKWADTSSSYPKTRSEILVREDGQMVAWGWSAIRQHAQSRSALSKPVLGDPHPGLVSGLPTLATKVKLALRSGKQAGGKRLYVDAAGRSFDVVSLIGQYLRALVKEALDLVQTRSGERPDLEDISWCLTVPAIWTAEEKGLMKAAAVEGGLIPDPMSRRMSLVLEPEAAAVACLNYCRVEQNRLLSEGTRFLVVDAGGGTVDLTMHDVDGAGLRECIPGDGDAFSGSTFVDQEFEKALAARLGVSAWDKLKADEPMATQKLRESWEANKCTFDGQRALHIGFDAATKKALRKVNPQFLGRLAKEQNGETDALIFSAAEVLTMFQPILDRIVTLVRRHVSQAEQAGRPPDLVFLVGGFAESPLLLAALREALEPLSVVVPNRPGQAVLEGAARLGLEQEAILSRMSRYTYGVEVLASWIEGQDPPERRLDIPDVGRRCRGRFHRFVRRGQSVGRDEVVSYGMATPYRNQERVEVLIFQTLEDAPRYVDNLTRIGQVLIQFPAPSPNAGRPLMLSFCFGSSEIRVTARDGLSDTEVHTAVHFERAVGLGS